ncbi:hypothetical protein B0H17DRAFT_1124604 [Mycena rosella]|uniref:Uncharacterized protein n=1 Tax=Mycena rosella TaxID=1033263 RepID=A0AAD7H073_MYCRO|nr:hypothetical protein B0H17DRAFT_1124604 [Mycena rosella]
MYAAEHIPVGNSCNRVAAEIILQGFIPGEENPAQPNGCEVVSAAKSPQRSLHAHHCDPFSSGNSLQRYSRSGSAAATLPGPKLCRDFLCTTSTARESLQRFCHGGIAAVESPQGEQARYTQELCGVRGSVRGSRSGNTQGGWCSVLGELEADEAVYEDASVYIFAANPWELE